MSTRSTTSEMTQWVTADDERPHLAGTDVNWSENYLTYVHSPSTGVSVYIHLCRIPGPLERWDEIFFVLLPNDDVLVSKSLSRRRDTNGVAVNGVEFKVVEPLVQLEKTFIGSARLVTGRELRAGPLVDGPHVPVELRLNAVAISPVYDFGTAHLDQEWAVGHYEQHLKLEGEIAYGDSDRIPIVGTGLRDHSWGPRDYAKIGTTTWIHAQFPQSGRQFMVVRVTGVDPKPEFSYAVTTDATSEYPATATGVPLASTWEDTESDYSFSLVTEDGTESTIVAEIIGATRCSFHGPAQLLIGKHDGPDINHDYVDAFTRFTWDGEVGYGVTERTVDRTA